MEQKFQMSAIEQAGFGNLVIALKIGVRKSGVGCELKRNGSKRGQPLRRAQAGGKGAPKISRHKSEPSER